jgi:hypothetical protein
MTKDGKSYVQIDRSAWTTAGASHRINGADAVRCKGDGTWAIVVGDVQLIERKDKKPSVVTRFRRNDEAPGNLPETLPADAFEYDYEDGGYKSQLGYDRRCYEAVYQEGEEYWTPLEFEIIDRDTEPMTMPAWAVVDWPANIEHYRETQHKYPCHITRESLFALVAAAVEKKIAESRGVLEWNDYRNIGTFTVKRWVDIPAKVRRPERVEYWPSSRSRKAKTKMVTREHEQRTLFTYNGFYRDSGKDNIRAPSIAAKNYEELAEAVNEHVDAIASLCDLNRYCICEKCNGLGLTIAKAT